MASVSRQSSELLYIDRSIDRGRAKELHCYCTCWCLWAAWWLHLRVQSNAAAPLGNHNNG